MGGYRHIEWKSDIVVGLRCETTN